jgi:hypothetical protein
VVLSFWQWDHNRTDSCRVNMADVAVSPVSSLSPECWTKMITQEIAVVGSWTPRRCTIQLNETQPEPLTALLKLNFCYQLQTALVPPDAHLSCYSSVANTFYPNFVHILANQFFASGTKENVTGVDVGSVTHICANERCSQVVGTPALYSGSPRFKSQPADRISWLG